MPCAVGFNILGGDEPASAGYNATECDLLGSPGLVALGLLVPWELSPAAESAGGDPGVLAPSSELELAGEAFKMETIEGPPCSPRSIPPARAFVGRFVSLRVGWKGTWATPSTVR